MTVAEHLNLAGAFVREHRKRRGLTQAELAERAHTAQSAISRLESGRISPTIHTLEYLLGELGYRLELAAVESDA